MNLFRSQLLVLLLLLSGIAVWANRNREHPPSPSVEQAPTARLETPKPLESLPAEPSAKPLTGTPDSRARDCQAQLKSIATGLEMYACDHEGRYPDDLAELVPTYLPKLPDCPGASKSTYREGYLVGQDAPHNTQNWPYFFHLTCAGHYHQDAGMGENLPALNARLGLMPEMSFPGTPQEARQACENNLKNIGTVLEMYAADNGNYPKTLEPLQANYLPKVPNCPASGKDTYSSTLKVGPSAPHNPGDHPQYFYLECSGSHPGAKPSTGPCYDSVRGLSNKP